MAKYPEQLHERVVSQPLHQSANDPLALDLTWKEVLYAQHVWWANWIHDVPPMCENLGYKYFCWNGRIYSVGGFDTGLMESDVE